jgi:putative hydrolase of the HAD superfamily
MATGHVQGAIVIRAILFDLDNTLYSINSGLEEAMQQRIIEYIAGFLGLSPEAARLERRKGRSRYGTTLEWLLGDKGFPPANIDAYYAAVHPEGEEATLQPDPALRPFLQSLPVPLAILTNSPREHADRILTKLGVADLFAHIFDMRWGNNQGKPLPIAFNRALKVLGATAETTLFIDDYPRYVEGYIALGGRGILLDELDAHADLTLPRIRRLQELTAYLD